MLRDAGVKMNLMTGYFCVRLDKTCFLLVVALFTINQTCSLGTFSTTITKTATGQTGRLIQTPEPPSKKICPELDPWREFDDLRGSGLDKTVLRKFFASRPHLIASRLTEVATSLMQAKEEWDQTPPPPKKGFFDDDVKLKKDTTGPSQAEASAETLPPRKDRGSRLCEQMASLGPICVKLCQTLSQRPDLVGGEAANALKKLQTQNVPFKDELAWAVIKESLQWKGPISPDVGADAERDEHDRPLFRVISEKPVATASLGQVYKATTHEGKEVAVKVQRPDGMSLLAKDAQCFRVAFGLLSTYRKHFKPVDTPRGSIGSVIDRVARDILDELDYFKEAQNGKRFEESLDFLGFVRTPDVVPKYSSERVLVTEWVNGAHIDKLPVEDGLLMTRMAVEACTASLVLTGFVHADPHEGNLMLGDDGKVVFLDFGLMSEVSEGVMEAFARGIQACLSEDWVALTKAFKDTGFVQDPIQYRASTQDSFRVYGINETTGEDLGLTRLAADLGKAMKEVEGGTSRFGALATVLNKIIAPNWQLFTPPYILLLIRTFLTLEGIAARVDPDFNIYEMAMPWAVRRSLSPITEDGIQLLRSTLLTEDNRIQWERLMELAGDTGSNDDKDVDLPESTKPHKIAEESKLISVEDGESAAEKAKANQSAKKSAMNDAVGSLLGSPNGVALRRALIDLDSTDLIARLASKEARSLRHSAALAASSAILQPKRKRGETALETKDARPVSEACVLLRKRQERWRRKVMRLLVVSHVKRQFRHGWRGALALARLAVLFLRIALGAVRLRVMQGLRTCTGFLLSPFRHKDNQQVDPGRAVAPFS